MAKKQQSYTSEFKQQIVDLHNARSIEPKDFEQIDIGIYECKTKTVIWENKTNILIMCYGIYTEYGYDYQALIQCANQANMCLNWIEQNKEYILDIISEDSMIQTEINVEIDDKSFIDRLCLRKIQIEIDVRDEIPQELSACMYIDAKPFLFSGHCHCIETSLQAKADGIYKVDVIEDMEGLLLEIRDALKEKNGKACEWAKKNGIFYAFDEEGNMLAVVKQHFCLTIDNKLILETDDSDMKKKGFSGNKQERSTLYFIYAKKFAGSCDGISMPCGFVTKELVCKKGVFTITSSSGHKAISGTFIVMREALTMIEMLSRTRGVAEEEIDKCYYTFLVEDHQRYLQLT